MADRQIPLPLSRDEIQRNFERFHAENPHVYALWHRFTREMIEAGFQRGSAKLVAERIRWETAITTTSEPPVKINNNYRSRYARLWMDRNPLYGDFFRTRELNAASVDSVLGAVLHYGAR